MQVFGGLTIKVLYPNIQPKAWHWGCSLKRKRLSVNNFILSLALYK